MALGASCQTVDTYKPIHSSNMHLMGQIHLIQSGKGQLPVLNDNIGDTGRMRRVAILQP